jgi:hypothetical protein
MRVGAVPDGMKPGIHAVLTYSDPGFMASGPILAR